MWYPFKHSFTWHFLESAVYMHNFRNVLILFPGYKYFCWSLCQELNVIILCLAYLILISLYPLLMSIFVKSILESTFLYFIIYLRQILQLTNFRFLLSWLVVYINEVLFDMRDMNYNICETNGGVLRPFKNKLFGDCVCCSKCVNIQN